MTASGIVQEDKLIQQNDLPEIRFIYQGFVFSNIFYNLSSNAIPIELTRIRKKPLQYWTTSYLCLIKNNIIYHFH